MKKHNGFTLVEVVVALGFIAILVVAAMGTTAGQYEAIIKTKTISEQNAKLVNDLENKVKSVKTDIENGTLPDNPLNISLFSGNDRVNVVYYKIEEELNDRMLSTYVSDTRIPGLALSAVTDGKIKAYKNNIELPIGTSYAYFSNDLTLKSEFTVIDPETVHFKTKYEWFVSREGFHISKYGNDVGPGKKPKFPDDYILIANETSSNLMTIKEEYEGKFITVAATPVTNFGKMGNRQTSLNEFYISGLPRVRDAEIKIHMDASAINRNEHTASEPNTEVEFNSAGGTVTINLKRWPNLIDIDKAATLASSSSDPLVGSEMFGEVEHNRIKHLVYAGYVNLAGGQILNFPYSNLNSSGDTTVFLVVRTDRMDRPVIFQKRADGGDEWSIGLSSIELGAQIEKTVSNTAIYEWQVIGLGVQKLPGDVDTRIVVSVNGDRIIDDTEIGYMSPLTNQGTINIGSGTLTDIAEIIVYDGFLDDVEYNKVEGYLTTKYFK